jgi:hypothetical protein
MANEQQEERLTNEGQMTIVEPGALEAISRAEIDVLVATAKKYPRSITTFRREAMDLATLDAEVASECSYMLKRKQADGGAKEIIGPSIRFAEIIAHAWGNSRAGARVVHEGMKFVTAQGYFADLEKNIAVTFEVQRRITGKSGNRYGDDMVGVTSMAACSIAMRNAVFHGIPKAVWKPIWERARAAARGDLATLETRRKQAFEALKTMGVDPARACAAIEVSGPADVGLDELLSLSSLIQAVREGDQKLEEAFPVMAAGGNRKTDEKAPEQQQTARDRAAEAAKKP